MDQVGALEVAPVHVPPPDAEGIVLKVKMILSAVIDHAVGIVVPSAPVADVELIAIRLIVVRAVMGIVRCSHPNPVESAGVGFRQAFAFNGCDSNRLSGEVKVLQRIRRQPVWSVALRQSHCEILHEPITIVDAQQLTFAFVRNRHDEMCLVNLERPVQIQ